MNMEKLHEQFIFNQMLVTKDIVQAVCEKHALKDDDTHCIDDLWSYLATLKTPETNDKELDLLVKIARYIMTILHSNACEERIISLINENKTSSRSSLQADNTLSSLLIIKTHIEDVLKWNPSESLIQKAKNATKVYNEQHRR